MNDDDPIRKAIQEFQRTQRNPSITCPTCGRTSYNTNDIKYRYCGHCKKFHDEMEKTDDTQDIRP